MHPRTTSRRTAAIGASTLALLLLGATACGDDDGDADEAPATTAGPAVTAAPSTPAQPAGSAEGCDAYAVVTGQLMAGQVDPAEAPTVIETFRTAAPDEIADPAATVADGLTQMFAEEGDPFADPAFAEALSAVGEHYFDTCEADAKLDVTGQDYSFSGVPESIPAGRVALRFLNESTAGEPHELVLLRRPDGDTTPVGELATMPPDELMGSYQFAGVAFSDAPGVANVSFLELEPGSYVAICNLPTEGDETDPHAAHGMIQAIEVTA
jgi:hypothetical protein